MLFDHQNQHHMRATGVAKFVSLLLVLGGVGYAISTQTENAQFGADLIGVSSARAVQQEMASPAPDYFPGGYVNQAQDIEEHIQAY